MNATDTTFVRDSEKNSPNPELSDRRTFGTSMKTLTTILSHDSQFAGVSFTEAYPEDVAVCPRVVWKLRSRRAGNNGVNSKNPFQIETIPLEDGRILRKFIYPQTFEVGFEIFAITSDEADQLRDDLEFWLMTHRPITAQCGMEAFIFMSEQEPTTLNVRSAQKVQCRTMYYTGVINYLYPRIEQQLSSIRTWRMGDTTYKTVENLRGAGSTDLSSVAGPLAIQFIHDDQHVPQADYVVGTDFVIIVDKEQLEGFFQIRWLPRGRQPSPGTAYYITYLSSTESKPQPQLPVPGAVRFKQFPRVLGQKVTSLQDNTIVYSEKGEHIANSLPKEEALLRAQIEIVTVIDESA